MVHFALILVVLVLAAVSITTAAPQQQSITSIRIERHAQALTSASVAGSGSAAGGSDTTVGSSEITASNAAIATQWKIIKVMLEMAFAGHPSLQNKLMAYSAKVDATLSGSIIAFATDKKMLNEFLMSLQSDPGYANITDKLSPILSALGISSSGSGSGAGNVVGSPSNGSTANATVTTPAPTASAASSVGLTGIVAPVVIALAVAVFTSL